MPAFPIDLRVFGRPCLVVGGGRIASRRIEALVQCGARVTVVAPQLASAVARLIEQGKVTWLARPFAGGDCAGMSVVLCAVDDTAVGPRVAADAHAHGALVNVADVPELCDFYFGALSRHGALTVSVHTDGRAPGVASRVRDQLAAQLDERTAERVDAYAELRRRVLATSGAAEDAAQRAEFLAEHTSPAALDALTSAEGMARAVAAFHGEAGARQGKVFLVGAGPGDPELLTLKAARLIEAADDLVVDALVPKALYRHCRGRVIYVGKRAGRPHVAQAEIGRVLVMLAERGRSVVRLKGGDPAVFARAGEELQALAGAGIEVEMVPGVSSVTAAAAVAGMSLSGRGLADRIVVLSGQRAEHAGMARLPAYDSLQTVVVLMGLAVLDELLAELATLAYPADLPAALVASAGTPAEQLVLAPLGELAAAVRAAAIAPPATLIIGRVAASAAPALALAGKRSRVSG